MLHINHYVRRCWSTLQTPIISGIRIKSTKQYNYTIRYNSAQHTTVDAQQQYKEQRLACIRKHNNLVQHITERAPIEYNNEFQPTSTIKQLHQKYGNIVSGSRLINDTVYIAGRIINKRVAGKKLVFYDVIDSSYINDTIHNATYNTTNELQQSHKLQLFCSIQNYQPESNMNDPAHIRQLFNSLHSTLHRGDVVGVYGYIGSTDKGELSVIPYTIELLTPCLHDIPKQLTDESTKYKYRTVDMLVNYSTINNIVIRSKIIQSIRDYLHSHEFIEVETPILWTTHGGAAAKPFITHSNALGAAYPLYLRIAPELFLKQLVIGGIERCYEISKVFRNEGIDHTHSPEFTSIEFYATYMNYITLMSMTENMIRFICQHVLNKQSIQIQQYNDPTNTVTIDFAQPFRRLDILTTLQQQLGTEYQLPSDVNSDSATAELEQFCRNVNCLPAAPYNNGRLLDKLIGYYIEPLCIQPTFLTGHPICMSPLSRTNNHNPYITDRYELFINGSEYCNAYSELNNAAEQYKRMSIQSKQYSSGDHESQPIDELYVNSLEYGLPPTAGFGLGIDRLVMLLTGMNNIRDVVTFPLIRSTTIHHDMNNNNKGVGGGLA